MGQLSCLDEVKNIGFSSCKKLPQQPKGIITTPPGFKLTLAQAADPAQWQTALLAAKGVRIYLFPPAVVFEDISEAAVYEETSLADIAVRDGRYKFSGVSEGLYTLVISAPDRGEQRVPIQVPSPSYDVEL